MDDFGNAIHWADQIHGMHIGVYGYSDEGFIFAQIDFSEVNYAG